LNRLEPGTARSRRPVLPPGQSRLSALSSLTLFLRAKAGEAAAVSRLFRQLLPEVRRWARGRLPLWARRRFDTDDLVQDAFVNLHRHLQHIEPRHRDAIASYLRQSIRNRIRDEVRRGERVEVGGLPLTEAGDPRALPDEEARQREEEALYRTALARLDPSDQELIVGRLELGLSYEQLALTTRRPSPDAARVAVRRAVLRLADEISDG
jgi:RNA polymerase sigma-70 factor (ECF subfamily)